MKKITKLIPVAILLMATLRCPPMDFLITKLGMDDILRVMAILGASAIIGIHVVQINVWVGLLVFTAAISHIYPIYSLYSTLSLFMFMLCVMVYYMLVKDKIKAEYILTPMAIFAMFHSGFLILHFQSIFPPIYGNLKPADGDMMVVGLMSNPNDAAAALAICLPALFRKKWCWAIPLILAGLYCAKSTGGILGCFVAGGLFLMMAEIRFKKEIFAVLVLSLAASLLFIDQPSASVRSEAWREFIYNHFNQTITPGIKNQTFFGIGLGNWEFVRQTIGTVDGNGLWTNAHNTFVHGFVEMGFPFLVVLAGYSYSILSRIKKAMVIEAAALGAIVTVCNTNSVFQMNAVNGMFIVFWLALVEIELKVGIQE